MNSHCEKIKWCLVYILVFWYMSLVSISWSLKTCLESRENNFWSPSDEDQPAPWWPYSMLYLEALFGGWLKLWHLRRVFFWLQHGYIPFDLGRRYVPCHLSQVTHVGCRVQKASNRNCILESGCRLLKLGYHSRDSVNSVFRGPRAAIFVLTII